MIHREKIPSSKLLSEKRRHCRNSLRSLEGTSFCLAFGVLRGQSILNALRSVRTSLLGSLLLDHGTRSIGDWNPHSSACSCADGGKVGMMQLQIKEQQDFWEPPHAGRGKKGFLFRVFRGNMALWIPWYGRLAFRTEIELFSFVQCYLVGGNFIIRGYPEVVMRESLSPWVLRCGSLCYLEKKNILRLSREDRWFLFVWNYISAFPESHFP